MYVSTVYLVNISGSIRNVENVSKKSQEIRRLKLDEEQKQESSHTGSQFGSPTSEAVTRVTPILKFELDFS